MVVMILMIPQSVFKPYLQKLRIRIDIDTWHCYIAILCLYGRLRGKLQVVLHISITGITTDTEYTRGGAHNTQPLVAYVTVLSWLCLLVSYLSDKIAHHVAKTFAVRCWIINLFRSINALYWSLRFFAILSDCLDRIRLLCLYCALVVLGEQWTIL